MSDSGWRVKEILQPSPEQIEYRERMVKELKALNLPKRPVSTVQAASTQAIINRPVSEDEAHYNRVVSTEGQTTADMINKSDVELSKLVGTRDFTVAEIMAAEAARKGVKNTIGQSEKSATTPESRELAIHAYTYSQPAELSALEKAHITRLTEMTGVVIPMPESPQPPVQEA